MIISVKIPSVFSLGEIFSSCEEVSTALEKNQQ